MEDKKEGRFTKFKREFLEAFHNTAKSIEDIAEEFQSDSRFSAQAKAVIESSKSVCDTINELNSNADPNEEQIKNFLNLREANGFAVDKLLGSMKGMIKASNRTTRKQHITSTNFKITYKVIATKAQKLGQLARRLVKLGQAVLSLCDYKYFNEALEKVQMPVGLKLLATHPKEFFSSKKPSIQSYRAIVKDKFEKLTSSLKGRQILFLITLALVGV